MPRPNVVLSLLAGAALLAAPARAQEVVQPVDLGVLRDSEVMVVQKLLYPMAGRTEVGLHLGLLPFDPYTVAPSLRGTATLHRSETLGFELAVGGGYGFKNSTYLEMEGPAYGIAPEAYRYLASLGVAAEWSPAYAKLNWRGNRVFHHNFYLLGGLGGTVEQSVLPSADLAVSPGLTAGVGLRIFHGEATSLRVELRDDIFIQSRAQTESSALKQNVAVSVGLSRFSSRSR